MQHVTVYASANYYLEFRWVTLHCTFNHPADLFKMTHAAMRRYLLSLVVQANMLVYAPMYVFAVQWRPHRRS